MSRAKFDASQPSPRPNGVAPASTPVREVVTAGKLAAVVGVVGPIADWAGPPGGAPLTSITGPLSAVRGVHAPPQMTPRDRASSRVISTSRASMRIDGADRSILSRNSLILAR